jgi:hypothetical protein
MSQATISNNQSNALVSDAELLNAFYTDGNGRRFQYVVLYVPAGETLNGRNSVIKYFYANSIAEAEKIASEAGIRLFNLKKIGVTRA